MLAGDARIVTRCGDCEEPMELRVTGGAPVPAEGVIHFPIPAARWWDDVFFT